MRSTASGVSFTPVLVVGAGPTGLTLACELARRGVPVRIIDRALCRPLLSRATDIHPRTLELLTQLGIVDALLDTGCKVRAFNGFAANGASSHLRLEGLDSPYPYTVAVLQNDTERFLEQRLERFGVFVERGVELSQLTTTPEDATVTLTYEGGHRQEVVRCAWVAGCDGVASTVRQLAGIGYPGRTYDGSYLVADAEVRWSLPHDEVHMFTAREGFANVIPLPDGTERARILCSWDPDDRRAATPSLAVELFAQRTRRRGRMANVTNVSRFRIQCRLATRFRQGPVLLLGDAAHTCSPLLGQGMNLGIQDAFNLGWKLALALGGGASANSIVDSYEFERRPANRASLWCTHMMHLASVRAFPGWAVDNIPAALASVAPARHAAAMMCSELGVRYAPNILVGDEGGWTSLGRRWVRSILRWAGASAPPSCGERAPDAPLASCGGRLMGHFDGRMTVLAFVGHAAESDESPRATELSNSVRRLCGTRAHTFVVHEGPPTSQNPLATPWSAHERYGGSKTPLYVVRPDGYVGVKASWGRQDKIVDYLQRAES